MVDFANAITAPGYSSPLYGVNYIGGGVTGAATTSQAASSNYAPIQDYNPTTEKDTSSSSGALSSIVNWFESGFQDFAIRGGVVILGLVFIAAGLFLFGSKEVVKEVTSK